MRQMTKRPHERTKDKEKDKQVGFIVSLIQEYTTNGFAIFGEIILINLPKYPESYIATAFFHF